MLDMYALKRIKINNAILSTNKKLQVGHPQAYEQLLRAEGKHELADKLVLDLQNKRIEDRQTFAEMRNYVSQNVLNPSNTQEFVFDWSSRHNYLVHLANLWDN